MSWECPYNINDYCKRLNKECDPGTKGCILYGKVTDYSKDENDEDCKNCNK